MEITASMVKQLREMTGAGVMACKNATLPYHRYILLDR